MRRSLARRVEHQRIIKKRPRKQLLLKLGVFLLLGVVVNVAVAWGALWQMRSEFDPFTEETYDFRSAEPPLTWSFYRGSVCYMIEASTNLDYARPDAPIPTGSLLRSTPIQKDARFLYERGWGWPAYSLRSLSQCGETEYGDLSILEVSGGVNLPNEHFVFENPVLPLRPIWPGFAINTIFYAAMLWLLWIAPGRIKRFFRMRGHRCPACGYQIAPGGGIGPVCSECGAALPRQMRNGVE
jgi:hypothetical protein